MQSELIYQKLCDNMSKKHKSVMAITSVPAPYLKCGGGEGIFEISKIKIHIDTIDERSLNISWAIENLSLTTNGKLKDLEKYVKDMPDIGIIWDYKKEDVIPKVSMVIFENDEIFATSEDVKEGFILIEYICRGDKKVSPQIYLLCVNVLDINGEKRFSQLNSSDMDFRNFVNNWCEISDKG